MTKLAQRGLTYLGSGLLMNMGLGGVCLAQGSQTAPAAVETAAPASSDEGQPSPATEPGTTPTYRVENAAVQLLRGQEWHPIAIEGTPQTATYHQGQLYITHGDTTVTVYDCSNVEAPTFVQRLTTGRGVAVGVALLADKPWVLTVTQQALPVEELAIATTPASNTSVSPTATLPVSPTGETPRLTTGYAVRVTEPGLIAVSTGQDSDVRIGDRLVLFRETAVDNTSGTFSGEEQVAIAEVVAVKEGSALAELSRTASVSDKDVARRARPDQTESNIYPVRVPHVGEFGGTLRPIVNAGSPLGVGVLADVYATYWGHNYFVNLAVQPLGLGWTEEGNVVSTSVLLEGGYDARAFSVGLGAGVSAINGDSESMLSRSSFGSATSAEDGASGVQETDRQETHAAFTLSQRVRLGALDGLNLSLRNLLILQNSSETDDAGFIYGGTIGKLTVPLDRRNDLFLEGGGGVMGYWLVGAGVGTWITGNGSPGSWKLSISAGAAGIWGTREVTVTSPTYTYVSQQDVEVGGPMVSFAISRRFGF